jgi:hypothetical protein
MKNDRLEIEFNILDRDSNIVNNHKNWSYCNKPFTEELWCKDATHLE